MAAPGPLSWVLGKKQRSLVMAEIDKIKEEVGWLKVIFAILVAIDVSLIGWAAQNFSKTPVTLLILSAIMVMLVTVAIVVVNRRAYKKLMNWESYDERVNCDFYDHRVLHWYGHCD